MQLSNRTIAIGLAVIVGLLLVLNSFFVVNEREQAIVTRFGQIEAVHEEPGLHFKMPFAFAGLDNVQIIEDRLLRVDLDDIRVQTSGGRFYIVNAFITYEIDDAVRFRQTASGDLQLVENRLRTRFEDAVRGVYGRRGFEAALSEARAEMMREVTARLQPEATRLGLAVEDVRIRRTDLTPEVSEQTFARMRAERLAEAERLRARGNEAAQRIRAIANRQVVEIESDAVRESEILRGQGEGERNRIFADAFGQDPQFFEFYRSMEAYRRAFEGGEGTRMVLSPDSEFLEFLLNPGVASPVPANLVIEGDEPGSIIVTPQTGADADADADIIGVGPTDRPSVGVGTTPTGPSADPAPGGTAAADDGVDTAREPALDVLATPGVTVPGGEPGDLEEGPGIGDTDAPFAVDPNPGVAIEGGDPVLRGTDTVAPDGAPGGTAIGGTDALGQRVGPEGTAVDEAADGGATAGSGGTTLRVVPIEPAEGTVAQ